MGLGGERSSSKKRLTSNGSKSTTSAKKKSPPDQPNEGNCVRICSAILTRVLFAMHTGIALWRVSFDYPITYLYFLSIGLVLLLFEMAFALGVRKGKEYKWFCPSVLFYLMSVVPCLWLLELARFNVVTTAATRMGICNVTATSSQLLQQIFTEPIGNTSESNRTKRHAPNIETLIDAEYNLELSETFFERVRRQASDGDPPKNGKKKRRGRRKKQKPTASTPNANSTGLLSEATKSVNGSDKSPVNSINATSAVAEMTQNTNTPFSSSLRNITSQLSTNTSQSTTTLSTTILSQPHASTSSRTPAASTIPSPDTSTATSIMSLSMTSLPPQKGDDGIGFNNLGTKIKEGFSNIEHETANIFNKTAHVFNELDRNMDAGTWILLLHQVLLFVLVIGRWLLPKGEITRDQLSQLLLVFIGVGADILEFVTETIDGNELDRTSCSMLLHFVIYAVWSWSLLQFTLVLTASKSRKTRVGFEARNIVRTNKPGCCGNSIFASADLWGILVTLFLQDVPFLATRLYILIVYNLKHQMMIFFTGKNALVVILQIYRIIVLKLSRKNAKEDAIDQSEMEPLRGTLHQLARRATMASDISAGEEIRDATFKRERDGSMIVKIHLEGEETLRKKRKPTGRS